MKGSEGGSVCFLYAPLRVYDQWRVCCSCCNWAFCCKVTGALPPISRSPSLLLAALQELLSVTGGCQLRLLMLTRHHCQRWEYKAAHTRWHRLACAGAAERAKTRPHARACSELVRHCEDTL